MVQSVSGKPLGPTSQRTALLAEQRCEGLGGGHKPRKEEKEARRGRRFLLNPCVYRRCKAKKGEGREVHRHGGNGAWPKGGVKKMTEVTYICRGAKKKHPLALFFLIDFFMAFFGVS
jgi:hypothetical protein